MIKKYNLLIKKQLIKTQHTHDVMIVVKVIIVIIVKTDLSVVKTV